MPTCNQPKVKPAVNYFMSHVGMGTDPRGLRSYGEIAALALMWHARASAHPDV